MTGFLLVPNAAAGSAARHALDTVRRVLGDDTEVAACEDPDDLAALFDRAGERTMVVAGGDGSLHTAVRVLQRTGRLAPDKPLGLIPLGTGNDFARTLEIPLPPAQAAEALLRKVQGGEPRVLDLVAVEDDDEVVVNAAHVGIGAEAAERATRFKPHLGPLAYPVGSALAGVRPGGWELRVEVDGEVLAEGEMLMVGLGLGRTIGGGTPLAPGAAPDNGLIDVVASLATGPFARVGYAKDLREGDHVERPDVRTGHGTRVRISGEAFGVNEDGELSGPVTERTWTLLPGAYALWA